MPGPALMVATNMAAEREDGRSTVSPTGLSFRAASASREVILWKCGCAIKRRRGAALARARAAAKPAPAISQRRTERVRKCVCVYVLDRVRERWALHAHTTPCLCENTDIPHNKLHRARQRERERERERGRGPYPGLLRPRPRGRHRRHSKCRGPLARPGPSQTEALGHSAAATTPLQNARVQSVYDAHTQTHTHRYSVRESVRERERVCVCVCECVYV
jgi:hypothetical protein